MDEKKRHRISDLLEFLIVLSLVFLFIVLTVPIAIWEEEAQAEKEARFRMKTMNGVQQFYKTLTGQYENDDFWAIKVVNAVRDSVVADSMFVGEQLVLLDDKEFVVEIPDKFNVDVDTTFGFQRTRRDTMNDTTVTYLSYVMKNTGEIDYDLIDTSYTPIKKLSEIEQDSLFIRILKQEPVQRVELTTYYDTYAPDSSFMYCPVTIQQFITSIEEDQFRIDCPIADVVKEPRYLIFSFSASNHGYMKDGVTSWD